MNIGDGMAFPKHLEPLRNAFTAELLKEDDLGVVVRSQTHIENMIHQIINELLLRPDQLKEREDREYSQSVRLALALGMDLELKPILNALGKLRNDFAHKLDSRLDKTRTKELYDCFPEKMKIIIQQQAKNFYQKKSQLVSPKFADIDVRSQLSVIVITVWVALAVFLEKVKQKPLPV